MYATPLVATCEASRGRGGASSGEGVRYGRNESPIQPTNHRASPPASVPAAKLGGRTRRAAGYDRFEAVVPDLTFEFGHVDLATAPRQELQRAPGEGEAFHSGGGLLSGEDLFGAHKEPSPLTGTADDADTGHEVIRFSDDPLVGASVGRRYTDVWQQERRRPGSSPLHNKLHASEPGRREVEVYWDGETSRQLPKCMTATTET